VSVYMLIWQVLKKVNQQGRRGEKTGSVPSGVR
jgi:hypothetical protein